MSSSSLYQPIQFNNLQLSNRVALAPLTRFRAQHDHTPTDLMAEYYEQRAATPGSFLITEATFISEWAGLYEQVPGIWNGKHVKGWKKIADRVHKHDSKVFMQLWALGKQGSKKLLNSRGHDYVAPSAIKPLTPNPFSGEMETPRELRVDEIKQYVKQYGIAAKNAIEAGMDGIEIHGAHGYLLNQFCDDFANTRTDEYGGSIENKARFMLEAVDAAIEAVGADKVGLRISPWLNMGVAQYDVSPLPQFTYILSELKRRADQGKQLAYIHIVEPRVAGYTDLKQFVGNNDWVRLIWDGPLIRAGGYTKELAEEHVAKDDNLLIAFGRYYISNPDIKNKLEKGIQLDKYNRKTFYTTDEEGYTTYTRSDGIDMPTAKL